LLKEDFNIKKHWQKQLGEETNMFSISSLVFHLIVLTLRTFLLYSCKDFIPLCMLVIENLCWNCSISFSSRITRKI